MATEHRSTAHEPPRRMSRTRGNTAATTSPCTTRRTAAYPNPVPTSAWCSGTGALHRAATGGCVADRSHAPWPRTAVNSSPRAGTATTPATTVPSTSAAMLTAQSGSPYRQVTVPSSGSTIQRTRPWPDSPPSSPRIASPGRSASSRRAIRASAARSISVTTSVGLDLVSATSGRPNGPAGRLLASSSAASPAARRARSSRSPGSGSLTRSPCTAGTGTDRTGWTAIVAANIAWWLESAQHCPGHLPVDPLPDQLRDHRNEPGVVAGGSRPGQPQAHPLGGLRRLDVQVVVHLHVIGGKADRDQDGRWCPGAGQVLEVVADVRAEPGLGRWPATALVDQAPRMRAADPLRDEARRLGQLCRIQAARRGPAGCRHGLGHAVRRENQRNTLPQVGGQRLNRRPGLLGERLDEPRMVEEMPQLIDPGGARANLGARRCDVIEILPAAGVGAVGRGHEADGAPHPRSGHIRHGGREVRRPVPVAPVHGQVKAGGRKIFADSRARARALLVERAAPAGRIVMLGHRGEPLPRYAAAPGDILQKRHDLIGSFRSPEGDEQERVVMRHATIQPGRGQP